MFKDIIRGVAIGDIHWDAFDATQLYKEMEEVFFPFIQSNPLDIIIINGDYWDCRTSMTSESAIYGVRTMDDIIRLAVANGCKTFRVLKGTLSHDKNQLDIFSPYTLRRDIDFKIINNVKSEEVFPQFNVLYIPEEYMEDPESYYAPYRTDVYDMVFGHGLYEDAIPVIKEQSSEVLIKKAPIFRVSDFQSHGDIIFSHVHKYMRIKDKVLYTSSFSRWAHGEEEEKGFIHFEYDMHTKTSKSRHIVNTKARTFVTRDFDQIINHMKAEEIVKMIKEIKVKESIDFLRVVFKVNVNDKEAVTNWMIVKEHFNRDKSVKIMMNKFSRLQDINIDNHQEFETVDAEIEAEVKKYWYLFDKSVDYIDKVVQFMTERGARIDRDKLENMISVGEFDILKELTALNTGQAEII